MRLRDDHIFQCREMFCVKKSSFVLACRKLCAVEPVELEPLKFGFIMAYLFAILCQNCVPGSPGYLSCGI
jgi:hypothetical protein